MYNHYKEPRDQIRSRIYEQYLSTQYPKHGKDKGLESRESYLNKLVKRHFPISKDAVILDLGCGSGALIQLAVREGYRNIKGIDRSPEQVQSSKKNGLGCVEQEDMLETLSALPSDSNDLIVAFAVIEHFQKNEVLQLLDDIFRVLKKGGRFLIHCPNGESPFWGRVYYGDAAHEFAFTRWSLNQILFSVGFRAMHYFEDSPIIHGIQSALRWVLWKGIRGLLWLYVAAETGSLDKDCIFSQNLLCVAVK